MPEISISTTTEGGTYDEIQRVGFSTDQYDYLSGTFTLTFGGQTTSSLAFDATAATVEAALVALSNIGPGDVAALKLQDEPDVQEWRITFGGALADANQSQITVDSTNISSSMSNPITDIEATDVQGSSTPADEVQLIDLDNATGGTFRLAFAGQTTAPIAFDASASTVDAALEALSTIGSGDVSVSGSAGGPWTVTFAGALADTNVPQLQGDAANSSSGSVVHTIETDYNAANEVTGISDSFGSLAFTLDGLGRVTSETQTIDGLTPSIVLATTYDANNRRTQLAATIGGTADFKNDYLYDNMSRLTRVTQQGQSGGNAIAAKRVHLAYNAASLYTSLARYESTGTSNHVATTTFAYNDNNWLTGIDHDRGATVLNHYSLDYDQMGRIIEIDSTLDGLSTFSYDVTSQLTAADHASPRADEAYSFDDNGNRNMSGYTVGTNNRVTEDPNYLYEFDDEGNLTRRESKSTGYYETYEWDHRNRLIAVTFYDDEDNVLKVVEHSYDALNRWVRRSVDPDGPGGSDPVDTFFAGYDGINPTLQFDGDSASDLSHRYLWGELVDQIFAEEDVSSLSSPGALTWPLLDHLGSARDLAQHNQGTGVTSIANHRVYNAFGSLTSETNSSIDHLFGFTAKPLDDSTGLQNNLFRWYSADVGWWLSEDPLQFSAGDSNLRRYVGNSTTGLIDQDGLKKRFPRADTWYNNSSNPFAWSLYGWSAWAGEGIAQSICDTYYGVANMEEETWRNRQDMANYSLAVSQDQVANAQNPYPYGHTPPGTTQVMHVLADGNVQFMGVVAGGAFVKGALGASPTIADEMVNGGGNAVRGGATSLDDTVGAGSRLVPGAGLAGHEGVRGGHTIGEHVGRTVTQLTQRLAAQPRIPVASTFTDRAVAERAIAEALAVNESNINTWLAGNANRLPLPPVNVGYDVGVVLPRGSTTTTNSQSLQVVLQRDTSLSSSLGYTILTAYPVQ